MNYFLLGILNPCTRRMLGSYTACVLWMSAAATQHAFSAEQCAPGGLHIKIQSANATATRRKVGFQCGSGCALKYYLSRNEERFYEEIFNWGCPTDLSTILFRKETYKFNRITTVDPDSTTSGAPVGEGCVVYDARQTVSVTGSYVLKERGGSPGAVDFTVLDYWFPGDGWKDRLNSNAPVQDPWFEHDQVWGWANWAPRPGAHCGGGAFLDFVTTTTPCSSGSGSNTTTREGRDHILFPPESEYSTRMLQAKVDALAATRLAGLSDKEPVSSNWLSPSGDCARADRSQYRFAIQGTIPGESYVIRWTEVRRFADGSTVAVQRKAAKKAPESVTWHFPSDEGAAMPVPTWPAVCPGNGGENSIWFTQVSIVQADYKANATLPDSRTMPGAGTVGFTGSDSGASCAGCTGSGSMRSDYPGVSFAISLGGGAVDGPGAELYLSEYLPGIELATPSRLRFSGVADASTGTAVITDPATGWITSALTRQARATVLPLASPRRGYRIAIHDPVGANLISTWTAEDPGAGTLFNRLRITQDGPNGAARVWDFSYAPSPGVWELTTDGGFSKQQFAQGAGAQTRTEEIKIMAPNNIDVRYKGTRVFRRFSWGEALESETTGEGASARTTSYTYLEAGTTPLPYPATSTEPPIRSLSRWDGSWEVITGYDSIGRRSGVLRGFDTALSVAPAASTCLSEDYSYAPQDPADNGTVEPRTPRVVIQRFKGIALAKTVRIFTPSEHREIQCANPAGALNDTNNLVTLTKYYTSGIASGQVRSLEQPDKTMSFFAYAVLPDGSTLDSIQTGEPNTLKTAIKQGTKTVTTHGSRGQMKSVVTQGISNEAAGTVLSNDTYSVFDIQTRPARVTHMDNTFEEVTYACCGLATMTDREGVQTTYGYDAAGRLERTIRNGITIQNLIDAAGRVYATKSVAGNTELFLRGTAFTSTGEVLAETNSFYGVTLFSEVLDSAAGTRIRTTTNPDLGVSIETTYRDGRLKQVRGNATMASRFEYGAEDDDLTDADSSQKSFMLEIKLDGSIADTPERTKTFYDAFGRDFKTAYASPTNPAIAPHTAGVPQVSKRTYYNSQGQRVRETDPDGVSTLYAYNGKGELQDTAMNCDTNTRIDYGGPDRITRVVSEVSVRGVDPVTRTVTSEWIDGGDVAQTVATTEATLDGRWTWDTLWKSGQAVTTSRNTLFERATQIRRVLVYFPDNTSETTVYQSGRLRSVTRKDATQVLIGSKGYRYDAHGRLQYLDDLRAGTTTYAYPSVAESVVMSPIPRVGESAQMTRMTLDNQGRTIRVTHPDLTTSSTQYNPNGQVQKTYGSRTYPVEYQHDAQGRLKTQWTWRAYSANPGDRAQTSWSYDLYRGWLKNKIDAASKGPINAYTKGGRLKTRQWARTNTQGQPLSTTYTYGFEDALPNNEHGDLVAVSYNDTGATPGASLAYDRRGRLVSVTHAGMTTSLAFSDDGQLLSESYSGGGGNELGFRFNGFAVGQDLDGTLRRQTSWIKQFGTPIHSVTHTYDNASRLQSVAQSGGASTFSAAYHYTPSGSLVDRVTQTYNGATRLTVAKDYDNLDRLRSIANTGGSGIVSAHTHRYNSANQRDQITLADGSRWDYEYDVLGQVKLGKRRWIDNTLVAGQQFEYDFDDIGNRKRAWAGGDAAGAGLRESVYNTDGMKGLLNQYNQRTVPGVMDVMGVANRSAGVLINGQGVYRKNEYYHKAVSMNNASQPALLGVQVAAYLNAGSTSQSGLLILPPSTEQFVFDDDGNLLSDGLWVYSWDAENRLVRQVSKATVPRTKLLTYDYDWRGRRVCKKVWENVSASGLPSTTYYLYEGWNLVAQLNSMGQVSRTYIWGNDQSGSREGAGGVGGLLAMKEASGTWHLCAYDGNGNVTALIEAATGAVSATYEYGPFGEPLRASGPMSRSNPFRWSTKYTDDETDLVYYGYRYYNPGLGRWLNRDPIGEMGGLNLFGFVQNSAPNRIDPLGLFSPGNHMSITANGLSRFKLKQKCLDTIINANLGQDHGAILNRRPFSDPLNHGDNSLLKPTIQRVFDRIRSAASRPCTNCKEVLESLRDFGKAIHALQDIYSHSNYVEAYGSEIQKASDLPLWSFLNQDGTPQVPPGVFSGLWPNDPKQPEISHVGMNHDDPSQVASANWNNELIKYFKIAESAATRHTGQLWMELQSRLNQQQRIQMQNCCQ